MTSWQVLLVLALLAVLAISAVGVNAVELEGTSNVLPGVHISQVDGGTLSDAAGGAFESLVARR
ncbi:MAG: hypothetical protein ACYC4R_09165 [Anaerolineae bacterium]